MNGYWRAKFHEWKVPVVLAGLVTLVFILKYRNVLPFSGYYPAVSDPDKLGWFGRYLFFAKEPLSFPFGLINDLGFPFQIHYITRGSIALFAFPLKVLTKFFPSLGSFFYFHWGEVLSVFVMSFLSMRITSFYGYNKFYQQVFTAPLIALSSFVLVRAGGQYFYAVSVALMVLHFYASLKYFYSDSFKSRYAFLLICLFPMSYLTDSYNFLAMGGLTMSFIGLLFFDWILSGSSLSKHRFIKFLGAFAIGAIAVKLTSAFFGNLSQLDLSSCQGILENRYSQQGAYGGGCGAGFHVADVFSAFIAHSKYTIFGKIPFFPSTEILQAGQYEGYAFIGSGLLFLSFFLMVQKRTILTKSYLKKQLIKFSFLPRYQIQEASFLTLFLMAGVLIYIYSWGNIWHLGGVRWNEFYTPSLIANLRFPSLVFARAPGRISFTFSIILIIFLVNQYFKFLSANKHNSRGKIGVVVGLISLSLQFGDISLNLETVKRIKGHPILKVLEGEDIKGIQVFLGDVSSIIPAPALRQGGNEWGRLSYALAYVTDKKLGGATVGMGILPIHRQRFNQDVQNILNGNLKQVLERYGSFASLVPDEKLKNLEKYKNIEYDVIKLQGYAASLIKVNHK